MQGEFLVAIINHPLDLEIARKQHWYRIPVKSVEKRLKDRWPPKRIAFYQTKIFGPEKYAINYFAEVLKIETAYRRELFPDEPLNEKSNRQYYKLIIDDLQPLGNPIFSRRWRMIVFIPTTWDKFQKAAEINDLWDESPLEDRIWAGLKTLRIYAERQEEVMAEKIYFLDFAVYCAKGKIDVETDGDSWHANRKQAKKDNYRDNNLATAGWKILRFNTPQIQENLDDYCIPKIVENINSLGGLDEGKVIPRKINLDSTGQPKQLTLFDDL